MISFIFKNRILLCQILLLLKAPGSQAFAPLIAQVSSTLGSLKQKVVDVKQTVVDTTGAIQSTVINALYDECVKEVNNREESLDMYLYLRKLEKDSPEKFYNCLSDNLDKMLPIVYTPVVGKAAKNYKRVMSEGLDKGLIISIDNSNIEAILEERKDMQEGIKLIVVTDGERVLGLGDMGVNAIAVLEGKLALYSAVGGIHPRHSLAVALDVGTNNLDFRSSKKDKYVGREGARVTGDPYNNFVNDFVQKAMKVFGPTTIIQFEGFATPNAYSLLNKYKSQFPVYNDNIQGTAAINIAGILSATTYRKTDYKTAKYLFVGAGRAALGLTSLLMIALGGITEENKKKIYMMDINGLITSQHCPFGDGDERKMFCHEVEAGAPTNVLEEIVMWVKPNILIGVSGAQNIFSEKVLQNMVKVNADNTANCFIMPLSTPQANSECTAEDALQHAKDCLFVSGTPFSPVFVDEDTLSREENAPGSWFKNFLSYTVSFKQMQCNSDSIFPGITRGLVLARMRTIPNDVFFIAAQTLSKECVKDSDLSEGNLYPKLKDLKDCSITVAAAIVKYAFEKGLTALDPKPEVKDYRAYVTDRQYACGTVGMSSGVKAFLQTMFTSPCVLGVDSKREGLEKYIYLRQLQVNNEVDFYKCLIQNVEKMLPLIYTPIVGKACKNYQRVESEGGKVGLILNIEDHEGRIQEQLMQWRENNQEEVRAIVVTDGERILGLGDQGANGMGIPVGKLALYTALGGVHPRYCLPVTLDVGTDNEEYRGRKANKYVGKQIGRVRGKRYWDFINEFVLAVTTVYGRTTLIQFEDFAKETAYPLLDKYGPNYTVFNDDIQGTAAVALAGLLAAALHRNTKLEDAVILIVGAGSAATGISDLILSAMDNGENRDENKKKIYMKDHYGLIHSKMCGHPKPYEADDKRRLFCHEVSDDKNLTDLDQIILWLKPSVLIGVTGKRGIFTEAVLRNMAQVNEGKPSPIIMPLSNPTSNSECTAEEAHRWAKGCLFASGSPFAPITVEEDIPETDEGADKTPGKRVLAPMQCNNDNIFPGVAFGIIIAKMSKVPNEVFLRAAETLAYRCLEKKDFDNGSLYPPPKTLRSCSIKVAANVLKFALEKGYSKLIKKPDGWQEWKIENYERFVAKYQYNP